MSIKLSDMTIDLCHEFFHEFTNDISVFSANQPFFQYHYSKDSVNAYGKRNQVKNRIHLAILRDNNVIGEIILKQIDWIQKYCTLSIHMKNDSVKNQGYGTEAEKQALIYAKECLDMKRVYANTLIHNTRSQHVLEKVGFQKIVQNNQYVYYKFELSQLE